MTLSAHPTVSGTTYMAVSGHPAASLAGTQILEAGGNAVDAGVAIGLCINVLESEMTGFAGVAPAMLRMAADGEVRNFVGVGPWPKNLDAAYFRENHDGLVPPGILDTVVPAAPDIWLTALQKLGTLSFGQVAKDAICLARDSFPMYLSLTAAEPKRRQPGGSGAATVTARPSVCTARRARVSSSHRPIPIDSFPM